jgi:hypothetical protein
VLWFGSHFIRFFFLFVFVLVFVGSCSFEVGEEREGNDSLISLEAACEWGRRCPCRHECLRCGITGFMS